MKRHSRSLTVVLVTMTTLALGVAAWAGLAQEVVEIADARLKFEINATDEDGGRKRSGLVCSLSTNSRKE